MSREGSHLFQRVGSLWKTFSTLISQLPLHDFLRYLSLFPDVIARLMASDSGSTYSCSQWFARRFHSLFRGCKFSSGRIVSFPSRHVPPTNCQGRISDVRRQCGTGAQGGRKGGKNRELSYRILVEIDFNDFSPLKSLSLQHLYAMISSLLSKTLKMKYKNSSLLVALGGRWPTISARLRPLHILSCPLFSFICDSSIPGRHRLTILRTTLALLNRVFPSVATGRRRE